MDSSGFVWCGTNNGVARFDGNRWEVITEQNGLANNSISAIATDTRGFVWFGTYEGGISRTVADSRKIFIDNVVGVEDEGFSSKNQSNTILPRAFSLSQNFPNPFNPSTTICYTVPVGNIVLVSLEIFNLRGFLIRRLVDNQRAPGAYTVVWDGTDCSGRQVPSGVYFYRIKAGGFVQTRKMVLLK
jgi:hypothetical protein